MVFKKIIVIYFLIIAMNFNFAQTKFEIDSLLNEIAKTENSKEITKTVQAQGIIGFGKNSLLNLASFFTDKTLSQIKSECNKRYLTKGEIAIIMADQIQFMPYAKLTGIQNCTLSFCKDNPNLVEYYLAAIENTGVEVFQKKYIDWLKSDEYKKYSSSFVRKTDKQLEKQKKQQ